MLDTDTVCHMLKKHPAAARRVVAVPIADLCISAITPGELPFGRAKRPEVTALHAAVWELQRRVDVLPWDATTARTYGTVRAAGQRTGRVLAPVDLSIGSHGSTVPIVTVLAFAASLPSNWARFEMRKWDLRLGWARMPSRTCQKCP